MKLVRKKTTHITYITDTLEVGAPIARRPEYRAGQDETGHA
jgi:hypothetical protein